MIYIQPFVIITTIPHKPEQKMPSPLITVKAEFRLWPGRCAYNWSLVYYESMSYGPAALATSRHDATESPGTRNDVMTMVVYIDSCI